MGFALLALVVNGTAQEESKDNQIGRFSGMNSCSSSGCHGGAAPQRDESVIWARRDFHSRAFATLTTARSARMGEIAGIASPTTDASCTVCHAPFHSVPAELRVNPLEATRGVSCESCHGPAESWLRGHTRPDWSHADRVTAGMRDLKNLYVRANTCVACHQNVPANLLAAGHPELIFELDGQGVSQPKHWREATNWSGAQTWLVGQAVALREIQWQLSQEISGPKPGSRDTKSMDRGDGLLWLLQKLSGVDGSFPEPSFLKTEYTSASVQKWADELARAASGVRWTDTETKKCLSYLAGSAPDFRGQTTDRPSTVRLSRRAERLVMGLDRLVHASGNKYKLALDSELNELFSLVQSLPDFNPAMFADALERFQNKQQTVR